MSVQVGFGFGVSSGFGSASPGPIPPDRSALFRHSILQIECLLASSTPDHHPRPDPHPKPETRNPKPETAMRLFVHLLISSLSLTRSASPMLSVILSHTRSTSSPSDLRTSSVFPSYTTSSPQDLCPQTPKAHNDPLWDTHSTRLTTNSAPPSPPPPLPLPLAERPMPLGLEGAHDMKGPAACGRICHVDTRPQHIDTPTTKSYQCSRACAVLHQSCEPQTSLTLA
jgi:hypothetical protein